MKGMEFRHFSTQKNQLWKPVLTRSGKQMVKSWGRKTFWALLLAQGVSFAGTPFSNMHSLRLRSPTFRMIPAHYSRRLQRCIYTDNHSQCHQCQKLKCVTAEDSAWTSPMVSWEHRASNKNPCSRWHHTLSMCMTAFLQLSGTVADRVHCSLKPAWYLSCLVLL